MLWLGFALLLLALPPFYSSSLKHWRGKKQKPEESSTVGTDVLYIGIEVHEITNVNLSTSMSRGITRLCLLCISIRENTEEKGNAKLGHRVTIEMW